MAGQAKGTDPLVAAPTPPARPAVQPKDRLVVMAIGAGSALAAVGLLFAGLGSDGWTRAVLVTLGASFAASTLVGATLVLRALFRSTGGAPQPTSERTERIGPRTAGIDRRPGL
jgi:hypothetical protein